MGVSTNYSAWFSGGTASTAVLTPAQVALVAPLVRVTAAYVVMYYAFCFFQSWSKLYLLWSLEPTTDRLRSPQPIAQAMAESTCTPSTRRRRRHTPSTRLTSAIAQEADGAAEHRRQEADAHAAQVW